MSSKQKFSVLIIGAGQIGAFYDAPASRYVLSHAHAFSKHPGFNLVGFVDVNSKAAKQAAARWGGRAFVSLAQAFAKHHIDVVINATPDNLHFQVLKEILNYPVKLVFTEKPLTEYPSQAAAIVKLARRKKVKLVINYHRRFVPEYRHLGLDIKRGRLGKYLTGSGYYGKGFKHNGGHVVDMLRFLIGEIESGKVVERRFDFNTIDPSVSVVLTLASGQKFFLQQIDQKYFHIFGIDLFFTKGGVRITDLGFTIQRQAVSKNKVFPAYQNLSRPKSQKTSANKALYFAASDIHRYLSGDKNSLAFVEDGSKTLAALAKVLS